MLFKLIEAVEVSFVSPRQQYTREWDKPAGSFLAVTYKHWVTIKHSGDENWDEFKSVFNWFWIIGVWGLGFRDTVQRRCPDTKGYKVLWSLINCCTRMSSYLYSNYPEI